MLIAPDADPVISMNVAELAPDGRVTGPEGVMISLFNPLKVEAIAKFVSPTAPTPCPTTQAVEPFSVSL